MACRGHGGSAAPAAAPLTAIPEPAVPSASEPIGEHTPHPARAATWAFERDLLGTRVRLLLVHTDAAVAAHAAEAAFARIVELDRILSDYRPDSELRRLTRDHPPGLAIPVSADLHAVLLPAADLARATRGAFDVTVAPLTRVWRRARRRGELPAPRTLERARARVGHAALLVQRDEPRVVLARGDLDLDLGGIAKGHVLDEVLATLAAGGVTSALVDAGGDLAASGPPPGRAAWRVALADVPGLPDGASLDLVHGALATSGDRFQRLELDGLVRSHLVDPRTGLPLTDRAAATVLAPTGLEADGLASALCVLPVDEGLALVAARPGVEARLARAPDGPDRRPSLHTSLGFPPFDNPPDGVE